MIAGLLALAGIVIVALQIWQDRAQYPRFKALTDTVERRRKYRYWTLDAFLRYGVLGIVGLFLLNRQSAMIAMPADFASAWHEAATRVGLSPISLEAVGTGLSGGLLIGILVLSVLPLLMRKFRGASPPMAGDIAALIPRTRGEIRWGAALSLNAGITEEIFFRLLMPFTWFALTGSALTALLVSVVLFGLVHAYQGVVGVCATMVVGAVLMFVYLATQQIWLSILLHVLIDFRLMVAVPLASGAGIRRD